MPMSKLSSVSIAPLNDLEGCATHESIKLVCIDLSKRDVRAAHAGVTIMDAHGIPLGIEWGKRLTSCIFQEHRLAPRGCISSPVRLSHLMLVNCYSRFTNSFTHPGARLRGQQQQQALWYLLSYMQSTVCNSMIRRSFTALRVHRCGVLHKVNASQRISLAQIHCFPRRSPWHAIHFC